MKFLYFNDSHLKSKTPLRRTGSFETDVLTKFVFLLITAQRLQVDFIVHGGDLFDMPNPSFRTASNLMKLIVASGVKWFQVIGNHDIIGHNRDSYDMGVLAFFENLPNFEILKPFSMDDFTVQPVHYQHGVEEIAKEWKSTTSDPTIIVAHAMVTPASVPFLHITPKGLQQAGVKARLVLLGHYHDPWAQIVLHDSLPEEDKKQLGQGLARLLTTRAGAGEKAVVLKVTNSIADKATIFLNPGSLSRIALLSHNMKRTPRALMIETTDTKDIWISAIPIEPARASEEVFRIERMEIEKKWESRIEDFLAAMEGVKIEGIDAATVITNTIKAIAGVERVDELPEDRREVLDYALAAVGKAEERGLE